MNNCDLNKLLVIIIPQYMQHISNNYTVYFKQV